MALELGDTAPDFTLPTDTGAELSLKSLRGKKVVLYFYPKDNTPGCTKEACDFRDAHAELAKKNVVVLGVSKDSSKAHANFKNKYQLPFTLLVDANADVCEAYGVINKKSLFGKTFLGIQRSTFLIDEHGKLQHIWRKVSVNGHLEEILNELN
ncbi:MAG TPA: thioredoxin-dependent thiol peroxidase [Gammaproteobacteria bacterium]|nr:thioredoxin-dependent thiol peroxidase [Gammaproteobacteria bacterium]